MSKKIWFVAFVTFLFISCVSSKVNMKKLDPNAFPSDFGNPKYTLLIQKRTSGINARGMNNYLAKSFRKSYSGKFEMATREEIDTDPKYKDKEVYRFVLSDEVWRSSSQTVTTGSTGTSIGYNNSYRLGYHLYDRLQGQSYPEFGLSSNVPAKAMKKVANALNMKLTK